VAGDAVEVRLAVALRVEVAAEICVMRRSRRHARSVPTRADRIVRIPAASDRQGEEEGNEDGEERFHIHKH
jgi:hypothetical protein